MKKTKTLQDMVDELLPYLLKIEIDSENSFLPTITIYLPKMWEVRQNNEEILIHTEHLNNKTMLYSFYSNTLLLDDLVKEVSDVIRYNTEKEEKTRLIQEKLEMLKNEMLNKDLEELKNDKSSTKKPNSKKKKNDEVDNVG